MPPGVSVNEQDVTLEVTYHVTDWRSNLTKADAAGMAGQQFNEEFPLDAMGSVDVEETYDGDDLTQYTVTIRGSR